MRIVSRNTNLENMGNTYTVQHIGEYLGENKQRLGTLATLWPEHSLTAITDTLANVFYGESKNRKGFTPVKKHIIEWDIEKNDIPKVYFTGAPTITGGNGANMEVFTVYTDKKYYDPNDTFALENGQQLFVVAPPRRLANEKWAIQVRLVASSLTDTVNTAYLAVGKSSIYRSNYYPELSDKGWTKFISDTETHRNYMSFHKHGVTYSMDYARSEDMFIETGKKGKDDKEIFLKLKKKEYNVYENFLLTRENNMVNGQRNFDVNGKCLLQDEEGQDIPMGDGVIRQSEMYAGRTGYSVLDTGMFDNILEALVAKSGKITGNTFGFVVNSRLYKHFGTAIKEDTRISLSTNNMLYSMKANDEIDIKGTFVSYEFQGNKLVFMPSTALTKDIRWRNKGYGIAINLNPDQKTGNPAVANYTMDGGEMIQGTLVGLGGKDGRSSGEISTPVTGGQYFLAGFSTAILANPYNSHIIQETII